MPARLTMSFTMTIRFGLQTCCSSRVPDAPPCVAEGRRPAGQTQRDRSPVLEPVQRQRGLAGPRGDGLWRFPAPLALETAATRTTQPGAGSSANLVYGLNPDLTPHQGRTTSVADTPASFNDPRALRQPHQNLVCSSVTAGRLRAAQRRAAGGSGRGGFYVGLGGQGVDLRR